MKEKRFDKIMVCSQWTAESLVPQDCDALISIRGLGDSLDLSHWNFNYVHRSRFRDVGKDGGGCMEESHAKKIWKFIEWLPARINVLIVHCTVGASRSPSVAMAICDKLDLGRSVIDWNDDVYGGAPNRHVYKTMMEAK